MDMNSHTQSAVGPSLLCFSKLSAIICARKPGKLQFPCSYSNIHDPHPCGWCRPAFMCTLMLGVADRDQWAGINNRSLPPQGQFAGVALVSALVPRLMNSVHSSALPFPSSSSKVPLSSGLFSHFSPPYFLFPCGLGFFSDGFLLPLPPWVLCSSHWAVLAVLGADGSMLWGCLAPGQAVRDENICLRPGPRKLRWHCLHPTRDNKNSYPEECGRFT